MTDLPDDNSVEERGPGGSRRMSACPPIRRASMKLIIPELKKQGFEMATVSELIADSGGIAALPPLK